MIRALLVFLPLFSGLLLRAAEPTVSAPDAAAAVEAPVLPPPVGAPSAAAPAAVAPPLPGQLQATPVQPRPALAPPVRLPDPPHLQPHPALAPAPTVPLNPSASSKPVSSTSSSGQFIVHGDDLKLRSAFSGRCEEIAESLRQLLRDRDPWELPIVVLLKTGDAARVPGPAVSTTISQIAHGGFHLQVNVNVRGDLRPADVRAELIRVLLAERILRRQKELASNRARLLPDWVFTGVLEALDYRQRARPSALFAAIFKSGKIYGIEEIIEASADAIEDGLSKTIYQTSCCALVLAILEHPEGGMRMTKFLNALASDKRPERELLNQWFPGFATTPASLNKWWSLQLATLASPSVSEPLSAVETAKQLDQALTLRFKGKSSDLPKPRPVVAAAPEPAGEEVEPATEEDPVDAAAEVKKPSFLSRLNPFAKKDKTDAEIIEDAAAEAALEEPEPETAQAPSPPPAPASPHVRKPLFGRGSEEKEKDKMAAAVVETPAASAETEAPEPKAPDTRPAVEKASAPAKEEPTASDKTAAEGAKPEKGSALNPLNWFRGGKKEKSKEEEETLEPPAETPPKKDKKAGEQAALRKVGADVLWAWSPLAGDAYLVAAQAAEEEQKEEAAPRKVEGFLGLKFGKKKDKEKAEAEPEPEPPAPAESKAKSKEKPKPEAPAAKSEKPAKPAKESAPEPHEKEDEVSQPPPSPSSPIKIKPLFGDSKKDEAPAAEPGGTQATKPEESTKPAKEPAPTAKTEEKAEEETPASSPGPIRFKSLFGFGGGKKDETSKTPPDESKAETPAAPEPKTVAVPKPKPKPQPPTPAADGTVDAALPIEDYGVIMKRKDRTEILQRNINALAALQTRAAVLFRPIVVEYSEVLTALLEGKTKGLDERLRSLRSRSEKALAQSKAVRDFVDLYEANESPVFSGLFDDYLKLPETIDKELPDRMDPLSNYLDALDREFSKE